jgi:cystathionine beta-lyase
MAMPEYYEAIINWFNKRHDWKINIEEIVYAPGTVYAIGVAVRAYTKPGHGIIIQRPVYFPFTSVIEGNGRHVVNNQMILDEKGYYAPNLVEFEALAKQPENTMFILCNPHNPSGRIFSDTDLDEMARICRENDVIIIADEIHGDLIRQDSKFIPIAKLVEDTSNIVTCTAINKTFNTAGLHATNMVITDKTRRKQFTDELGHIMPSPFSCNAVIAAYNEGEEWLEALKVYLDETIDWVMNFAEEHLPKMRCVRPEGTYIMWMDFKGYGLTAEAIHKKIYIDANVLLEGGKIFDPDLGDGFERICLSSPRAIIQEAFKRIAIEFKNQ